MKHMRMKLKVTCVRHAKTKWSPAAIAWSAEILFLQNAVVALERNWLICTNSVTASLSCTFQVFFNILATIAQH
jgi:hypothetical protein